MKTHRRKRRNFSGNTRQPHNFDGWKEFSNSPDEFMQLPLMSKFIFLNIWHFPCMCVRLLLEGVVLLNGNSCLPWCRNFFATFLSDFRNIIANISNDLWNVTGVKNQAYFADQGSRNRWNLMMAFNDMLQKELNRGCYRCDLLEIFLIAYAGGYPKIQRYRIALEKSQLSQKFDFRFSLSGKVWYCNKFCLSDLLVMNARNIKSPINVS